MTPNLQAVACSSSGDASSLDLDLLGGGLRSDLREKAEIGSRTHASEEFSVFYASETPAEGVAAPVEVVRTLALSSCTCFSDAKATVSDFTY